MSLVAVQASLDAQRAAKDAEAPSPEQKRRVDAAFARLWSLARTALSWQAMGSEVSRIYADVFTQEEIDAMRTFYASPTGQAMMAKAPALVGATMQSGGDLAHNDVLTPEEAAAFDAFLHTPLMQSMSAKAPLVRERMAEISRAHRERMRPQMAQILRDMSAPAAGVAP